MSGLNPAQFLAVLDNVGGAKADDGVSVLDVLGGIFGAFDRDEFDFRGDALQFGEARGHYIGDDDAARLGPAGRVFRRRRTAFQDAEFLFQVPGLDCAGQFAVDVLDVVRTGRHPGPFFVPGKIDVFHDVIDALPTVD